MRKITDGMDVRNIVNRYLEEGGFEWGAIPGLPPSHFVQLVHDLQQIHELVVERLDHVWIAEATCGERT